LQFNERRQPVDLRPSESLRNTLMASVVCKACKERIDRAAATCPHCGERVPRIWEMPLKILACVGALGGGAWYLSNTALKPAPPAAPLTSEKIEASEQEARDHASDLQRLCALRQTSRSADSFRLVKAVREPDGKLCVHYTVNNAMGSAVGERWSVPPGEGAPRKTASCDNLAGRDRTALLIRTLAQCAD
jgi:hypothetical protein